MTVLLHRVAYRHGGSSSDFRVVGHSFRTDNKYLHNFHYYARLGEEAHRSNSTWFDTDGRTSAVIRRFHGFNGDGRDDRARMIVGPADELDVRQALALACDDPVWSDDRWTPGPDGLEPISLGELPQPRSRTESTALDSTLARELVPIVGAYLARPDVPIWVASTMPEKDSVNLILALVDIAEALSGDHEPWTFSTLEDGQQGGSLRPRIQFMPVWPTRKLVSTNNRTIIDYHANEHGHRSAEATALVETYLRDGPEGLANQYEQPDETPMDPGPETDDVMTTPQEVGHVPDPPPLDPPPVPKDNVTELFCMLRDAQLREVPELIDRMRRAPKSDDDRDLIRRELASATSLTTQWLNGLHKPARTQVRAELLVGVAMGPEHWTSEHAMAGVRELGQAVRPSNGTTTAQTHLPNERSARPGRIRFNRGDVTAVLAVTTVLVSMIALLLLIVLIFALG